MNPSTTMFTDVALPAVGLIALAVVGLLVFGAFTWRRSTDALRARLARSTVGSPGPPFRAEDVDALPVPVARYLRSVLKDGQARVVRAHVVSDGEFRRGEAADAWIPMRAEQVFASSRPGFVWDARMRLAPGIAIRVVDAYVDGAGTMRAAVAGLVSVVDAQGTGELATGEMMRWLAETPWLPTALLPGGCVEWTALDDSSARATVRGDGREVSADFRFGPQGEVTEVFVAERPRDIDGMYVPTAWSGRFSSYEEHEGVRVPTEAVAQWHVPGGELPYWRARITSVRYELDAE
ncbi:MAG: hypothetical protein LJF04_05710 [Gemmatimonadetes bacterium]|nr:hypothetical protein [Gemmatimonadota bacterium]